jgi:hypothetical protein
MTNVISQNSKITLTNVASIQPMGDQQRHEQHEQNQRREGRVAAADGPDRRGPQ